MYIRSLKVLSTRRFYFNRICGSIAREGKEKAHKKERQG